MALGDGGLGSIRTEDVRREDVLVARYFFELHRRYMVGAAIERSDI